MSKVCFTLNFCICRDTELWAIVDGRIIHSSVMGLYKRWSFKRVAGTKKGFTGNRSKTIICNFRVESECTVVANKGHKTLKN